MTRRRRYEQMFIGEVVRLIALDFAVNVEEYVRLNDVKIPSLQQFELAKLSRTGRVVRIRLEQQHHLNFGIIM